MTTLPTARGPLDLPRLADLRAAAPQLVTLTLFIALAAVPLMAAHAIDPRTVGGEAVWIKPLKFHLALVVYTGTLALFALALPPGHLTTPRWRLWQGIVAAAILAELAWIGGAAALGTTSHFNDATPLAGALYGLMGALAFTLTALSLTMGLAFWQRRAAGAMPLALALGLILTFALTVVAAFTMASGTGHHVGPPVTGAKLPLLGWSREVGDLRAPHFLATHAMHAVPLAGLTGRRALVWAAAAGWTALTLGALALALAGRPLI
jgi:hypothetical protein